MRRQRVSKVSAWLGALAFALSACAPSAQTAPQPPVLRLPSVAPSASNVAAAPGESATTSIDTAPAELAAHRGKACEIVVETLIDSKVYRGSPSSQAKWDSYKQDPKYARFAEGIDHGAEYLACTFRVRVNGVHYRYEHDSHDGPRSLSLKPEDCAEPAEADSVVKDIATFTAACSDLRRGEYYGDFLKPEQ